MVNVSVIPRYGLPDGWAEKYEDTPSTITLPEGVKFMSTPGHGYLMVDVTKFPDTMVSGFDYIHGPSHVLLEEDCSCSIWLAEHGILPFTDSIRRDIATIPRVKALGVFCRRDPYPIDDHLESAYEDITALEGE